MLLYYDSAGLALAQPRLTGMVHHVHALVGSCVLPGHQWSKVPVVCRPNVITEDLDRMGVKKKRGTNQGQVGQQR